MTEGTPAAMAPPSEAQTSEGSKPKRAKEPKQVTTVPYFSLYRYADKLVRRSVLKHVQVI